MYHSKVVSTDQRLEKGLLFVISIRTLNYIYKSTNVYHTVTSTVEKKKTKTFRVLDVTDVLLFKILIC